MTIGVSPIHCWSTIQGVRKDSKQQRCANRVFVCQYSPCAVTYIVKGQHRKIELNARAQVFCGQALRAGSSLIHAQ